MQSLIDTINSSDKVRAIALFFIILFHQILILAFDDYGWVTYITSFLLDCLFFGSAYFLYKYIFIHLPLLLGQIVVVGSVIMVAVMIVFPEHFFDDYILKTYVEFMFVGGMCGFIVGCKKARRLARRLAEEDYDPFAER